MSTFCGRMREIPGISVDRFDGENLHSRAFFLSHCHQDHMQGLDSKFFQNLTATNRFLYTSDVSYAILSRKYPFTTLNIKELSLQSPTMVHLDDGTVLVVVTIPAGHCPGSVMFLFEGKKRVLYTGDYRCGMADFKKIKVFYDSSGSVQAIDSLYLDTTFLLKRFHSLPTRTDSIRALLKLIKCAINNDQIIFLKTSAYYGYEQCFKEVFDEFKMPVHVGSDSYEFYKSIPEMDECVTKNPSLTRIHSNCGGYKKICQTSPNTFTVTISVYSWTQSDLENGVLEFISPSDVRLCYSTHASYEEGMEFVKFLRPKRVKICVEPKEQADRIELEETIQDILAQEPDEGDIQEYFDFRKMSPMKKRASQVVTRICDSNINKRLKEGLKTSNTLKTMLKEPDDLSETNSTVSSLEINASCNLTITSNTLKTIPKNINDDLNQTNSTVGINASCNLTTTSLITTTLCNNQSEDSQNKHTNTSLTASNDIKLAIDNLNQNDNTIPPESPSDPSSHNAHVTSSVSDTLFNIQLETSRDIVTTDDISYEYVEKASRVDPNTISDDDYYRRELLSILGLGTDNARLKQDKTEQIQETIDEFSGKLSQNNLFLETVTESKESCDPVQEVLSLRISPCRDIEDSENSS